MKEKRFLLLIGLFLALAMFISAQSSSDVIFVENKAYSIGDIVSITLDYSSFSDTSLSILTKDKVYNFMNPQQSVKFLIKDEGEHIIQFYKGNELLDTTIFHVGEVETSVEIGQVSTDKSEYDISETVIISINVDELSLYNIELIHPQRTYTLFTLVSDSLGFMPVYSGEYVLVLNKGSEKIAETSFIVTGEDTGQDLDMPLKILDRRNRKLNFRILQERVSDNELEVALEGSTVSKIVFNNTNFSDNSVLKIDSDIDKDLKINEKNAVKTYAIDPTQLDFDSAVVTVEAIGTELWKCKDWDFINQLCFGSWVKLREITPGKNYSFLLSAQDPGFAETGVASINTRKPICYPNEEAEIIIVVLDNKGYPADAEISLYISDPIENNYIYGNNDMIRTNKGVYEFSFKDTYYEGEYNLLVSALGNNVNSTLSSSFLVQEFYEFDIIRTAPVVIDPWKGAFESKINIISNSYDGVFDFTEKLPINFSVFQTTDAYITEDSEYIYLTWYDLRNDSEVSYITNSPLVSPALYSIGPSYVSYGTSTFYEARSWYIAIDPVEYYNPNSTVTANWNDGTGTTYREIDDGLTPDTGNYVADLANDNVISEFGFQDVLIPAANIVNITLWVYTATGSNAQYTFYLYQGATTSRCSQYVGTGTGQGWLNCVWDTGITGDLTDLRIRLGGVTKSGSGKNTLAYVYDAYLEVLYDLPPYVVLNEPDNTVFSVSELDFNFTAVDDADTTLQNCSLYANFSGTYEINNSVYSVSNDTKKGITVSNIPDGSFVWAVQCFDTLDQGNFSSTNYSVTINAEPPSIDFPEFNVSTINQSQKARFNVSITDTFGISSQYATLTYPNTTQENFTLTLTGEEYFVVITDTTQLGTYTFDYVWANDTYGQENYNDSMSISFQVVASPPGEFNLSAPYNNTISTNIQPNMSWNQTQEPDFQNYTLLLDTSKVFSSPDFVYGTYEIDNTSKIVGPIAEDAIYYWRVIAYDIFGNYRLARGDYVYTTDNTAPLITLNTPLNNTYVTSSSLTLNYTPLDNNLFNCTLYGNFSGIFEMNETEPSPNNDEPNYFTINLPDSGYTWNVLCYDQADNYNYSYSNYTVLVDTKAPSVNLERPLNNTKETTTNNIVFFYNVSDEMADISSCFLVLNDVQEGVADNSITEDISQNITAFVENGEYNWSINCTDENGFMNSSLVYNLSVNVLIETDPPIVLPNYPVEDGFLQSSTVYFNYTPQDASGLQNCSLYIDGQINQTNSTVPKNVVNNFTVNNLVESPHTWFVECFDNSTYLGTNSSERTFTVDLTDPTVVLDDPGNYAYFNELDVEFNFTPSDTNLASCVLYGNFSGTFGISNTKTDSPTSDQENSLIRTLPDGSYLWNVWCNDSSSRSSFAAANYTVRVDANHPLYDNISVDPSSPVEYLKDRIIKFNITIIDTFIDKVWLEHNLSGTIINITINATEDDVWFYNFTNPGAGNYVYKWFMNDSVGRLNITQEYSYVITKRDPTLILDINHTESNISMLEDYIINLSTYLSDPLYEYVELYINGTLINAGNSPIENLTNFTQPGLYNITAKYLETQNYTFQSKTFYVEVNDTTAPVVYLMYPEQEGNIGTSSVRFRYNVSDAASIQNCSLYINDTYNLTDYDVGINTTETIQQTFADGKYSWYVECYDSSENYDVSETRNFTVTETYLVVNLTLNRTLFYVKEEINMTTTVEDSFANPQNANITMDIIKGLTSLYWWNSSWERRKPIYINESDAEDKNNELIWVNLTGLTIDSCVNEVRIVNNVSSDMIEVPVKIMNGNDADYCEVIFRGNITASAVNENNFYVYYNNSGASDPGYNVDEDDITYFVAQTAAADEGTPSNVVNIVDKNDANSATITATGGGATITSAHGRDLINRTTQDIITQVRTRYRFEAPTVSNGQWELRYSVDDGGIYNNAFTGGSTQTKITSAWDDITADYASLTWTELNRTRLQGRANKAGGGGSVTVNLYWVEMEVTYNVTTYENITATGDEQVLVYRNTEESGLDGTYIEQYNSENQSPGNYSAVSFASVENFQDVTDYAQFEMILDLVEPTIYLNYPTNYGNFSGPIYINFTWTAVDNFQKSMTCNLTVDNTIQNPSPIIVHNNSPVNYSVYVTEGIYSWNVSCADIPENVNTSPRWNFTVVESPARIDINISSDNTSIVLNWSVSLVADSYNVYISTNYSQGFSSIPNVSGLSVNTWTDNEAFETERRYYNIESVKGDVSVMSNVSVGKQTRQLYPTWNLISIPFNLSSWKLFDGSSGQDIFTDPGDCLVSLWYYNESNQSYMTTNYASRTWTPGLGDEYFTNLEPGRGYWAEVNKECNMTLFGTLPSENNTYELETYWNIVGQYSGKDQLLFDESELKVIDVVPAESTSVILRYNELLDKFEVTVFYSGWGWWPSYNNPDFKYLESGRAYYFDQLQPAVWTHDPDKG